VRVKAVVSAVLGALGAAGFLGIVPGAGAEVVPAPWWGLSSTARPTQLRPGPCGGTGQPECGQIVINAENLGDASSSGAATLSDQLPEGLTAVAIEADAGAPGQSGLGPLSCTLATVTCTFEGHENASKELIDQALPPYAEIEMRITVRVEEPAVAAAAHGELHNSARITGGGAGGAKTVTSSLQVGSLDRFGVEGFTLTPEEAGGSIDTQAGSHPFQLTTQLNFNSQTPDAKGRPRSAGLVKDLHVELPAGLTDAPTTIAQCTGTQFAQEVDVEGQTINECPESSAVGVATLTVNEPSSLGFGTLAVPIFNLQPNAGEPVRFGIDADGTITAILDGSLRSGGDYGMTLSALNISQAQWLLGARLTFWGVPGAAAHGHQRGWDCLEEIGGAGACPGTGAFMPSSVLTMPTDCEAPFQAAARADAWEEAGAEALDEPLDYRLPLAIDGCDRLLFTPEIIARPDDAVASTPTGLSLDVHVPQELAQRAAGLAESAIRDLTITLPADEAIDPSIADGLQGCTEGLAGFTGFAELPAGSLASSATFAPTLPEPLEPGVDFCPDASKIGTAEVTTPLLPKSQHLSGSVYLAAQNANPFGSLLALYVVAEDPTSGDLLRLAGEVRLSETGQVTIDFQNTPDLPIEDLRLHFVGGSRALLANPSRCLPYTTSASMAPWSGNQTAEPSSTVDITSGPDGGPCPGATLPFESASVSGGSTNINAGAFTPFTITLARSDGQQRLRAAHLQLPAGLTALLGTVRPCEEAQANAGICGPESQIGHVTVIAGVGNDPVALPTGNVYLTDSYAGAPFGLSIVTPVKAGPFDLEHDTSNPAQQPGCDCDVIRAALSIDPLTAQLAIATDAGGLHSIPGTVDGIPLQIRDIALSLDRERFIVNPTNCAPLSLDGNLLGGDGATIASSLPFEVTDCAQLAFTPSLNASTTSAVEGNGAALSLKLAYPANALGVQTSVEEARLHLPSQMSLRNATMQNACTGSTFATNPGSCPAGSIIGQASMRTPMLPVALQGTVLYVASAGAHDPEIVLALSGDGIALDLYAEPLVASGGVTTVRFHNLPDIPLEMLEVTLPAGPQSALQANLPASAGGSFCGAQLTMPTLLKAANGAELSDSAVLAVEGCPTRLAVRSRALKRGVLDLLVYVPGAGRLAAGGKGLKSVSKNVKGAELVSLALHPKHAGRSLRKARVKLTYTPLHGGPQAVTVKLAARQSRRHAVR